MPATKRNPPLHTKYGHIRENRRKKRGRHINREKWESGDAWFRNLSLLKNIQAKFTLALPRGWKHEGALRVKTWRLSAPNTDTDRHQS